MGTLLGSLIGGVSGYVSAAVVCCVVIASGWYAVRNESAKSAEKRVTDAEKQAEFWRGTADSLQKRCESLELNVAEQRELKHDAVNELEGYRLKTDLSGLMKQMAEAFESVNRRIDAVEQRLSARLDSFVKTQDAQTRALEAIATRLEGGNT